MAKNKMDKSKLNSYISLAFPESIDVYGDEDVNNDETKQPTNKPNKNINNTSEILKRQGEDSFNKQLAGGPGLQDVARSSPTMDSPTMDSQSSPSSPMGSSSMGNFGALPPFAIGLPESVTKYNPMLFGGRADLSKVARAVISEPDAPNMPTQMDTVAKMTPEEKLIASIANTNPTPSGFWKRLLVGAGQGARNVQPGDDLGTAFGKILGPAVTRAIPQVDSAAKYEENKAKALERYKLESGASNAKLQRSKVTQDIANDAARIKREEDERARRIKLDTDAQLERVTDNQRAEAKLKLDALQNMSETDKNRASAAKELADKYGVKVGDDYGIEARRKTEKETSETELRKLAETQVTRELGANTKERARGATANQLEAELKTQMPPDLYAALTDPNAGTFKQIEARKMRQEIEERVNKRNVDYTESDFENRVVNKMEELRGGINARGSNKPVTKSNKQGSNKVPPSNEARSTNFAKPGTVIKFR